MSLYDLNKKGLGSDIWDSFGERPSPRTTRVESHYLKHFTPFAISRGIKVEDGN